MADYSSVFSGGGASFSPSTFGASSSSYPTSYGGVGGISPVGGSFGTPSFGYDPQFESKFSYQGAKKPGFDWKALLVGLGQASPAIERAILRLRGFPESEVSYGGGSFRMAGSALADILKGQGEAGSSSLADTLRSAAGGISGDFSDIDFKNPMSLL